ncbi:protein kinase [Gemmatimonadota bacterium]
MVGRRIGQYQIEELVGSGAFGNVYKARDTRLDIFRALKFVRYDISDYETAKAGLNREARTQAKLTHPNIAGLLSIESSDEGDFLVQEYVEGPTLDSFLRDRVPSVDTSLSLILEISSALAYAHRNGVIHRDIKPANVLITSEGSAKVTDFGLAKALSPSVISTTLEFKGTPQYMAPEAYRGDAVGPPADVWALGILTYEVLQGSCPFHGISLETIGYQVLNEPFQPLSDSIEATIPGISEWIGNCLQKDHAKRYKSCIEAYDHLSRLISLADFRSNRIVSLLAKRQSPNLQHRFLKYFTGALIFVAGLIALTGRDGVPFRQFSNKEWLSLDTLTDVRSPSWGPEGRQLAYLSGRSSRTLNILDTYQPSPVPDPHPLNLDDIPLLMHWSPTGPYVAVSGEKGLYLYNISARSIQTLFTGAVGDHSWSSEGDRIIATYAGQEGEVILHFDLLHSSENDSCWVESFSELEINGITTTSEELKYYYPVFVRDDRFIAVTVTRGRSNLGVWIVPSHGGVAEPLIDHSYNPWYLDWDSKGNNLLFLDFDGNDIYSVKVNRQGERTSEIISLNCEELPDEFDYHPGTSRYSLTSYSAAMHLWQASLNSTSPSFQMIAHDFSAAATPALSASLDYLVFSNIGPDRDDSSFKYSILTGNVEPIHATDQSYQNEYCPTPDPVDNRFTVFIASDGNRRGLYYYDQQNNDIHPLLPDSGSDQLIDYPAWAPGGDFLVFVVRPSRGLGPIQIRSISIERSHQGLAFRNNNLIHEDNGVILPHLDSEGRFLLFEKESPGPDSLFVKNLETGRIEPLSEGQWPTLSPSGTDVYFLKDARICRIRNWLRIFSETVVNEFVVDLPRGISRCGFNRSIAVGDSMIFAVLPHSTGPAKLKWSILSDTGK